MEEQNNTEIKCTCNDACMAGDPDHGCTCQACGCGAQPE